MQAYFYLKIYAYLKHFEYNSVIWEKLYFRWMSWPALFGLPWHLLQTHLCGTERVKLLSWGSAQWKNQDSTTEIIAILNPSFFSEVFCWASSCCPYAELFPRLAGFKWISACEEWEKQGVWWVYLASEPFASLWNKCCFSNGRLFVFPLRLSLLTGRITTNQG